MWDIVKDKYYTRRAALEAYLPKMLNDPRINAALIQIELAEAAIDYICKQQDDDEEDYD